MSYDTRTVYNPLPYNIQDKNPYINRQGLLPSYQYKKRKTIWLNTAYCTSSVNNGGTTYYEFSWDMPQFQLYNQTKLIVSSYISNDHTAKPMCIKLKNLLYDEKSTWSSDKEGYPMLFVEHTGATGMTNNDKVSLTLVPQIITNITIKVTDSFTSRDAGVSISGAGVGHFVLCLIFEDEDLVRDDTVSAYK